MCDNNSRLSFCGDLHYDVDAGTFKGIITIVGEGSLQIWLIT